MDSINNNKEEVNSKKIRVKHRERQQKNVDLGEISFYNEYKRIPSNKELATYLGIKSEDTVAKYRKSSKSNGLDFTQYEGMVKQMTFDLLVQAYNEGSQNGFLTMIKCMALMRQMKRSKVDEALEAERVKMMRISVSKEEINLEINKLKCKMIERELNPDEGISEPMSIVMNFTTKEDDPNKPTTYEECRVRSEKYYEDIKQQQNNNQIDI
jgi:hypothetical protein